MVLWAALQALSVCLSPYWLNRAVIWALYYPIASVVYGAIVCFEGFSGGFCEGLSPIITARVCQFNPFRASGADALVDVIFDDFYRVPEALELFFSKYVFVRVLAAIAALLAFLCGSTFRDVRQSLRFGFEGLFSVLISAATLLLLTCDFFVFLFLVADSLLPLLCIFAALALLSFLINLLRPSVRPKNSAPCLALLAALYIHFNADAVDDWMVPFFTLIAVIWLIIVLVNRYLSLCVFHARRSLTLLWARLLARPPPRVQFRDGAHCTPRGGRLFCDDDAECAICMTCMRGGTVRAHVSS